MEITIQVKGAMRVCVLGGMYYTQVANGHNALPIGQKLNFVWPRTPQPIYASCQHACLISLPD
ncbi:hypothetical protein XHV734_0386 [Xanthomonas hortorum pv. vitians]|nr:hypothetical protein XHV734_0386 [Xanthomonas hortorum pv. vitians]